VAGVQLTVVVSGQILSEVKLNGIVLVYPTFAIASSKLIEITSA
jgi:hypothetical protein